MGAPSAGSRLAVPVDRPPERGGPRWKGLVAYTALKGGKGGGAGIGGGDHAAARADPQLAKRLAALETGQEKLEAQMARLTLAVTAGLDEIKQSLKQP